MEGTPNTPAELIALNEKKMDTVEKLGELMKETTLKEAILFARKTVEDLMRHHKEVARGLIREMRNAETDDERWDRSEEIDVWTKDVKHLQAALDQLKLVEVDSGEEEKEDDDAEPVG